MISYVYVDVIFITNLIMTYAILWLTSKISQIRVGWKRVMAGSALGAMYSVLFFLPRQGYLFTMTAKFLFSVAILLVTFWPIKLKTLFRSLGYFYLVSFFLGGLIIGLRYLMVSFEGYSNFEHLFSGTIKFSGTVFYTTVAVALITIYVIGKWGLGIIKNRFLKSFFKVPLKVRFGQEELKVDALVDTGNSLRDPISNKPVIIVEYGVLQDILPSEVRAAFQKDNADAVRVISVITGTEWSKRFRIIPFSSLGKSNGVLIGFRPDEIVIQNEVGLVKTKDVIVGIYTKQLCSEGTYRALLHPDVLDKALTA